MTSSAQIQLSHRTHYRLTSQEWREVWQILRPAEIRILYHLKTLDPFGDKELEIGVRELARELEIHHTTVSRALKVLDQKGYINLELLNVKVKVRSHSEVVPLRTSGASTHQMNGSKMVPTDTSGVSTHHLGGEVVPTDTTWCLHAPLVPTDTTPEKLTAQDFERIFNQSENLPEQICSNFKENRTGTEGVQPVEKQGEMVNVDSLCQILSEGTGIPVNAALRGIVQKIQNKHPEEAQRRIQAAVAAYLEQQETVHNPQGFISAALRRGFTSNEGKKVRNKTKQNSSQDSNSPADLSDLISEISVHCRRLSITSSEALIRFGRPEQTLATLNYLDLATLRSEMRTWI